MDKMQTAVFIYISLEEFSYVNFAKIFMSKLILTTVEPAYLSGYWQDTRTWPCSCVWPIAVAKSPQLNCNYGIPWKQWHGGAWTP